MDTGTHIVMGVALGGLAMVDPVVAAETATMSAVIAGVIVGSLIPDVDTVLKLRSNAVYIRHHRGITHSIPAVLLWPLIISVLLLFFVPSADFIHLWVWTFLAVFLHVFVDIFNAYGTQALRPFSNKWVAIGVINTFDPIIFISHIIALTIWAMGANSVYTLSTMYVILFFYYLLRFAVKSAVKKAVFNTVPDAMEIFIAPTMRFFHWRIAASSETYHYVGRAYGRSVNIYDRFDRKPMPKSPQIDVAMGDKNMEAFTSFSPIYRWSVTTVGDLCEVRLIDLRYRSKGYYPFVAVAHVDNELNVVNSYTGWIFSEDKLNKKLNFVPNS
ncbi:metal-dependent hydrolase [Sporosarcina limicola]|uniref:Inner membrane protein n=1 Tax=Sporosarcina limicola TaxID=34101 RepID=A0A927MMJ7_9BACL|nr:metal-dependent hydrolase [Sporosarcina limicola]MBE1555862.1 inner membrane protein [Sporosarcina limicola]